MPTLFQCPECLDIHPEPADASYVIAVLCEHCAFELRWSESRLEQPKIAREAA